MATEKKAAKNRYRPVNSILISQPDPQSIRSPFYELAKNGTSKPTGDLSLKLLVLKIRNFVNIKLILKSFQR